VHGRLHLAAGRDGCGFVPMFARTLEGEGRA
jgi:hypothetical protein